MSDRAVPGRMKNLLLKCAANLEDGCDPMHSTFLQENNISADECYTLSQQMAAAIKGYARAPKELAAQIIICSCVDSDAEAEHLTNAFSAAARRKDIVERLKRV